MNDFLVIRARVRNVLVGCMSVLLILSGTAQAGDPMSCKVVRFATVDWADITATTALASVVLEGLGYEPTAELMSVAMAYARLKDKDLDVFLGNWMPAQKNNIEPYLKEDSVQVIRANLEGAKFTLAVPRYAAEGGLKDFKDIAKFWDKLDGNIYGIEPGSNGNFLIQQMIDANAFDLNSFYLVPSSEAGMLARVEHAIRRKKWIVFLGWEPHPMNTKFDIVYLTGGDDWFGPNYGGATVYTVVRKGYLEECPNVGNFLKNLKFSLKMENEIMATMAAGKDADKAAVDWLREHPKVLNSWLDGVTTFAEGDAVATVRKHLGLETSR